MWHCPRCQPVLLACRWELCWFVADQDSFRSADRGSQPASASAPRHRCTTPAVRRVVLGDVAAVKVVHDPSLPDGHAFWVELHSLPAGTYFVAGAPAVLHVLAAGPCNTSEAVVLRAWLVEQRPRRRQRVGWMRSCYWRTWRPRRACLRCAGRLRLVRPLLESVMLQDSAHEQGWVSDFAGLWGQLPVC